MRRVVVVVICLAFVALVSCKRVSTGAKEYYGKEFSCPDGRFTIKERPDLKWGSIILDGNHEEPPDEIKKDPGRVAKWREEKNKEKEESRSTLDRLDVFEAEGCDHHVLMGCGHSTTNEGGCDASSVSCWTQDQKK